MFQGVRDWFGELMINSMMADWRFQAMIVIVVLVLGIMFLYMMLLNARISKLNARINQITGDQS